MTSSSAAAMEGILLITVVSFLLPLRLLSLCLNYEAGGGPHRHRPARSAIALLTAALLLSAICADSDSRAHAYGNEAEVAALRAEILELKLHIARLETVLEENTKHLTSKADTFKKDNKLIEAMERDIQSLIYEQENIKKSLTSLYPEDKIKSMEEEVQFLKEEVRAMNANVYLEESLANDAEKRVEALNSEIKKIQSIISEQWIQVRQFEQAFQLTKMMTSRVHKRSTADASYNQWPGKTAAMKIMEFIKDSHRHYITESGLPDPFLLGGSFFRSCVSQVHNQLKRVKWKIQRAYNEVLQHAKVTHRHIQDIDIDGFLSFGASFTRSCIYEAYKRFKKILPEVQRFYNEVLRFITVIRHQYIPDVDVPNVFFLGGSVSRSYFSLLHNQFKRTMTLAQTSHNKIQKFLRHAMESNGISGGFTNELITFSLAYIIVVAPLWITWMLFSVCFGKSKK